MTANLDRSWQQIRVVLRDAVGDRTFELWLAPLRCLGLDGETLVLDGPPEVAAWARARYVAALRAAAATVLNHDVAVSFTNEPQRELSATPFDPPARDALNPKYTFEQFVIGASNRLAHAAALAVAETPTQAYNPLFIYGPPGLGKTHLLHAIGNYIRSFGGGLTLRYATAEEFTNAFLASLLAHSTNSFKARFRAVDVLLIDDVQFFERKARSEEEMFHTFNTLYEAGSQLVVTCDRVPSRLDGVESRLRERFAAGLVTDISSPDFMTRLAILRKRAAFDGVPATDEALDAIARTVTTNVRTLEGALVRAVALASLERRPLTGALAKESLMRYGLSAHTMPAPTISAIQAATCVHFHLSEGQLLSRSRQASITWARHVAMYLARELTDHSLPHIAREFAGRDHTTVLHAWRKVASDIRTSRIALEDIEAITAAVHATLDP